MPKKTEAFAIKSKDGKFHGGKAGWVDDLNEAVHYFTAENAQKKGPGDGKVIKVVLTTTAKES